MKEDVISYLLEYLDDGKGVINRPWDSHRKLLEESRDNAMSIVIATTEALNRLDD